MADQHDILHVGGDQHYSYCLVHGVLLEYTTEMNRIFMCLALAMYILIKIAIFMISLILLKEFQKNREIDLFQQSNRIIIKSCIRSIQIAYRINDRPTVGGSNIR